MSFALHRLESVPSTNSWVTANAAELSVPSLVYAVDQTAGRGQRGNSWESEPGRNLTASLLFVPRGVPVNRQFLVSEAVALAVCDLLGHYGVPAEVKWPNDVYAGERKICGILIEHSVMGREITRTVAGVGVNLNQRRFLSDAPNPVSLWQLTGRETDIEEAARLLADYTGKRLGQLGERDSLHGEFMSRLWRREGYYPFADRKSGERIRARIAGVAHDGVLTLELGDGEQRSYFFKEIEYILNDDK